jgi:hypothetical protein
MGFSVGIGTTAPAQALDIGSENIKMGFAPFAYNSAAFAAQTWTSLIIDQRSYRSKFGPNHANDRGYYAIIIDLFEYSQIFKSFFAKD